mmetsp:Transcript_14750/g.31607  ORF Transcript_14750/g.31607 Transcript_14750/m.31607 type:complete len:1093 (-) Transcript_14750:140-3418(-)|eukprot:CAMPEP_0185844496 /NCGR_PEP_ID=MMETSP1354-20130828/638_1 /TAXON_ID=708628 /ORGANISM="Erythrolobus madagascarensis, Strain CCMP3276" /LENGTH=1092 /DNA_ID=CAMNT_0028544169 /DNA_START=144 /DNA_END=3422 /DNA_ORIENTATION=-
MAPKEKTAENNAAGVTAEMKTAGAAYDVSCEKLLAMMEERDRGVLRDLGGVTGLAEKLRSDTVRGVSVKSATHGLESRRAAFGPNKFKYPPPKSFFRLMLDAFKDVTVIILSIAAVVSLVIGLAMPEKRAEYGYVEGIAIVLVVVVVVMVQTCIDFSKERKFRQLNSVKDNYDVMVTRDGENIAVVAEEVVVGDVVKISAGDKLAADGVLIEGANLKTNESAMTGEVIDISKTHEKDPFVISGTSVSEGVGHVLIVAVGERSQWGLILKGLIVEPEDTPLQERLDKLAMNIGKIGIIMAVLTFTVSMIRWIVHSADVGHWDGEEVLTFFIDAVTIVVVAIPEGLPLAITLGLAFAMRKMMQDSNLVRRLEACETMGSATQLNADKTGTLTQNRMTVVQAYLCGTDFVYEGAGDEIAKQVEKLGDEKLSSDARALIAQSIAVNTQANLQKKDDGTVDHLGSKTECALLQLVENWGLDYNKLRTDSPPAKIYLFNSAKKRMSTTTDLGNDVHRLHCKGAPEIVIKLCTSELSLDGKTTRAISEADHEAVVGKVNEMASQGLRTLLLCYRDLPGAAARDWEEAPETEMTFVGVLGIKDPIRPETRDAVLMLKQAGVIVRMVTGDNPLTAKFIAHEAGILDGSEGPNALLEGPVFRKMSSEEKRAVALDIRVLARSSPTDKLVLVRQHKALGEVVSVTGDGTNDAPALKEADVGFALGLAGTEIAKEACDIVILDDNIQSMAKAVLWGRNVYTSIRKFLQFQLVVNVVAVTLNFISACAGVPLPLGAVPLLWVNMIMDSMGALALATEPPRMSLMERKPFGRVAPLINRGMFRNIIGMSIYQLIVSLVLQFAGHKIFNIDCFPAKFGSNPEDLCYGRTLQQNSMIFNVFVFMQIFNEVNSRRIEEKNVFSELHRSHIFIGIIIITIGVQVAIMLGVGITRVGEKIGIVEITGPMWGAAIVLGALTLPLGFLIRLVPLDWCFGPNDDDVTEMSKIEKLLHFPQRKAPEFEAEDVEEDTTDDMGSDSVEKNVARSVGETVAVGELADDGVKKGGSVMSKSRRLVKLRVYVHAVAFVNVVQRSTTSQQLRIKDVPGASP